jgi:aryl-alcohol dehydrogenase-like predicted oxidoreductase
MERSLMEYRRLGRTGLMVSELCLGTMTFGRELDEEGSREIIARFLEAGGNFVDTANVYENSASSSSKTTSEPQVGSFLRSRLRGSRRRAPSKTSTRTA